MKQLYTLEGEALQRFLREITPLDGIRTVRFCVEDGLQVKVNEDVWTVPLTKVDGTVEDMPAPPPVQGEIVPEPVTLLLVKAVHLCKKCGTKVTQDEEGTWVDTTGGDACDVGVHYVDLDEELAEETAVRCPNCGTRNGIREIDVSERWNDGDLVFEGDKLVGIDWSLGDGDWQHERFECTGCSRQVHLPEGVDEDALKQEWS